MRLSDEVPTISVRGLARGEEMRLYPSGISFDSPDESVCPGRVRWEVVGSVSLEDGQELEKRVTLTRVALLGVFALAAKKKTGGTKYLAVSGDGFFWAMEVGRKDVGRAQRFVMRARSSMACCR